MDELGDSDESQLLALMMSNEWACSEAYGRQPSAAFQVNSVSSIIHDINDIVHTKAIDDYLIER